MKQAVHILTCLTALSLLPAPLRAADPGPCSAFTDSATYVSSTIIMQLEHRRVPLRVPIEYFEDPWDRVDGVETTSQLFSVDINDFTPVTRPQTAERNMAGRDDYMWFTLTDQVPTHDIALLRINDAWVNPSRKGRKDKLTSFPPAKGTRAGLVWLDTETSSGTARPYKDVFVAFGPDGKEVITAIKCSSLEDKTKANPMCEHLFTAGELDVDLSYTRTYLDRWREIQADVTAFANCAVSQFKN